MGIAKGLGKPVKVDLMTLNFERARFARVCVEVNLKRPLKGTIMINGERYFVAYEGLTNICSCCGLYGHLIHNCPKGGQARDIVTAPMNLAENVTVNASGEGADGFVPVKQVGRRQDIPRRQTEEPRKNTQLVVRRDGGRMETNRRDSRRGKDTENIRLSNSFGSLGDDTGSEEVRERAQNLLESDKENFNSLNQREMESSEAHGSKIVFGAMQKTNGLRNGSKGKKLGNSKGSENITNRPNKLALSRPTRGLIFGPTKGEIELSVNGKRLRVEQQNVGRPGGCFAKTNTEEEFGAEWNRSRDDNASMSTIGQKDIPASLELGMNIDPSEGKIGTHSA